MRQIKNNVTYTNALDRLVPTSWKLPSEVFCYLLLEFSTQYLWIWFIIGRLSNVDESKSA